MDPTQSATESIAHLPYNVSLPSIVTAVVGCSLGLFYFFVFSKRVATNAVWHALTKDALSNPAKAREQWLIHARELLYGGLAKAKRAIAVSSPTGPTIFLPNSFAQEIRNLKEFSFSKAITSDFMAQYRGLVPFQALEAHEIVQEVVRLNLTRSLDSVTQPMNEEAEAVFNEVMGNTPDWQTVDLKSFIYRFVARLSTRVFLGPELANNKEWLDIAVSYTANSSAAVYKLRAYNPLWRYVMQWFIPELAICQQQVTRSRALMNPLIEERRRKKANGEITQKSSDMLSWLDDKAKEKGANIHLADFQLLLAMAAIHTTTETLSLLLVDVIETEGVIPRLREEMVSILSTQGWKKTAFASMTLLDSAMKESQRLSKLSDLGMQRKATANVTLSDGTVIPKGYKVSIEHRFYDSNLYPDNDKFVVDRFVKLRDTDRSKWHFVTGSPEHLGFGYGMHACPGRFFASNEMKIAMIHLLLKYDWKFTEQGRLPIRHIGPEYYSDQTQKVMFKSRTPEIDLASL